MKYKVKIIEMHSDTVEVEADSKEEAISEALEVAECDFETFYDAEVDKVD